MTSKVYEKNRNFDPPVDLKPLKILTPKLDWITTSSTPTTVPFLVKFSYHRPTLYAAVSTHYRASWPIYSLIVDQ